MIDRRPHSTERGTTIAEVMVVVALLGLIAVPILATLRSATRAEDRIGTGLDADADLRRIEQLWLADVRGGQLSLNAPAPLVTGHALRLLSADSTTSVEWRRTDAGLERRELASGGAVVAEVVLVPIDRLDPDPGRATFTYHTALGATLDASDPDRIDACAVAITLSLWEADRADPAFALTAAPRVALAEEACP